LDSDEFLQTPHPSDALHYTFPSLKWQVEIIGLIFCQRPLWVSRAEAARSCAKGSKGLDAVILWL